MLDNFSYKKGFKLNYSEQTIDRCSSNITVLILWSKYLKNTSDEFYFNKFADFSPTTLREKHPSQIFRFLLPVLHFENMALYFFSRRQNIRLRVIQQAMLSLADKLEPRVAHTHVSDTKTLQSLFEVYMQAELAN